MDLHLLAGSPFAHRLGMVGLADDCVILLSIPQYTTVIFTLG